MQADSGSESPGTTASAPSEALDLVSLPPIRPRGRRTPDRIFRTVLWGLALTGVLLLVWSFSGLIFYLLIGMFVAYMTRPLVDRIRHLGIHRTVAILVSFLIVFSSISVLLTSLVPIVANQLGEMTQQITADTVAEWATAIEVSIRRFLPIVPEGTVHAGFARISKQLFAETGLAMVITYMVDLFTNLLFGVLIVPIVAFFLLKDAMLLRRRLMQYVPNRFFEIVLGLVEKIQSRIGRYVSGLLIQIVAVTLTALTALLFTDLEYPLVLAIFTGVANTIPYFGPIAGFTAGTLMALGQTGDFSIVPGLLIAMSITQFIDNSFFQPFIFSRAVRTHPLVILFVVLIGAQLNGIVGMLLALPITTAALVTFEQVMWSVKNYRLLRAN